MVASDFGRLPGVIVFSCVTQSLLPSVGIDGDNDLLALHTSAVVLFVTALPAGLNRTITAVILSHPVPSPQVSGARQ